MSELPVAERWFRTEPIAPGLTLLVERHLDPFFESNIWHVRGRDRDLVVDTGNGIGHLPGELAPFVEGRPVVAVVTHDHFDHAGGLHAFEERWCHVADADGVRAPDGIALRREDFRPGLEDEIRWYGYEPPDLVITALPHIGFDLAGWRTPPAEPTRLVEAGDVVDLGDRSFEVLHLPGHTAGSIGLWDAENGLLMTGDTAALDDPLHAEDEEAFLGSLRRLRDLPAELVAAGHSRPFGRPELIALIDRELRARS
ncbi:MAG TPA: MBL fold metallo-hydrolase [Actinomycetota bacterium]|nr:MBL fold metallo-hydrolase [Actinomycetota bacterium]